MAAPVLSAVFKATDEISDIFDRIATRGERVVDQWESAGSVASEAFERAAVGAAEAAEAAANAASSTDYWTDSLGNYDRSAMEAIYSTEELVALGYKTEEALTAEAKAADDVARKLEEDAKAAEDAAKEQEKMGQTGSEAIKKIEDALTAAGLTKLVYEIADAVVEMANAFSEAESIVVKATGATGDTLDSLTDSMMNVYAVTKDGDLSNVAGAIGEINTRLGLQGAELDHTTKLFMDYSQITGTNVVSSIQNVTKVMKNWDVEVDSTESLLDKFAYAAQASGASVDSLSGMVVQNKASLQQLGYGLDESIALLAMFEYEGLNSSSIMMGFRSAITGFSSEGKDASVAMQEVIDKIGSMSDESEATAVAIETFGSRAGAELAYAIRSGKFEIDEWVGAVAAADGTLATTADAATTLEEKWTQASNNMNTAFSSVVSPAVDAISSGFAGVVQGIGDFLNKSPVATAAVTGLATGLVAVIAAIAIYKVAMTLGTVVTAIFGTTLSVAIWPITLVVAAIAALTTGLILLFNWLGNANAEFNGLTATSKQNYEQLEELNAEYDETVALYGENSQAAQQLAQDIAGLEAVYEATKMTLEEFVSQNDALIDSHDQLVESYQSGMTELDKEEKSSAALIGKLEQLASKTDLTAGEQQQMSAIIGKLNEQIPDLALSYDDFTGSVDKSVESVRALAQAQAKEQRQVAQHQAYVGLLSDQAELEDQLAVAAQQRAAAQERFDTASGWDQFWDAGKVKSDLEDLTIEEDRLQSALAETNTMLAENEQAFEDAARATEEAERAAVDYETGVSQAIQSVSAEMNELITAYDEAYEAARSSIDSTIGLFDTMATETELSINDMVTAMQSQVDYLATYTENLQKAAQYGLDEGLIASLSDGSEESAGYIDAIIGEIERLGGSTEGIGAEAAAFVDEFNGAFQETESAKDEFAATVAEMETDFNAKMDEIESRLNEAIDNMSMEADAAAAAKDTMQAYINQIKSMTGDAHSAAAAVASATASALGGRGGSIGITGYATGTKSAERGVKLVGEDGPELVSFSGGETVYNAGETERIFSVAGHVPLDAAPPADFDAPFSSRNGDKKITLEINGSGEIDVGGADEETIWGIVAPKLKSAFVGIIKQEIFEEGDLAYEF